MGKSILSGNNRLCDGEFRGERNQRSIDNSNYKQFCYESDLSGKRLLMRQQGGAVIEIDAQVNGEVPRLEHIHAMKILQTTKAELKSCFKISLMDTEIDVEAVKDMQKCGKTIGKELNWLYRREKQDFSKYEHGNGEETVSRHDSKYVKEEE